MEKRVTFDSVCTCYYYNQVDVDQPSCMHLVADRMRFERRTESIKLILDPILIKKLCEIGKKQLKKQSM